MTKSQVLDEKHETARSWGDITDFPTALSQRTASLILS